MKEIYIAGGCFWGVQAYFDLVKGIEFTEVGYANGNIENPSYEDLKSHRATHAETLYIRYDEKMISLKQILFHMLRFVNPFSVDRQGGDTGHQYRSGVYYLSEDDRKIILDVFAQKERELNQKFAIEVEPLRNFYPAEEYHQKYLKNNPNGYCHVNLKLVKEDERK
ncbi:MAG: peptide-methionine (S)-S-oxide reductase MsrA [Bacilli bacterium]